MHYEARRRLVVGAGAGFLVLALLAPLIAGLVPSDRGEQQTSGPPATLPEATEPPAIDESEPEPQPEPEPAPEPEMAPASRGCPAEDGSSPRFLLFDGPHEMCIDVAQTHVAVFDTSEGEIRVTLDTENTPGTVNNFVTLARWGYYDGTTFFRTDPSIDIIQGGSPRTESLTDPGPGYTIPDEPQLDLDAETGVLTGPYEYLPGQLVMARTQSPDSSGAQFFFSTGPNTSLLDSQGIYVVFGMADAAGLEVLQRIIGLHVPGESFGGAPSRTVTVNSVTIEVS